jgi:hypothetical protein
VVPGAAVAVDGSPAGVAVVAADPQAVRVSSRIRPLTNRPERRT